MVCYSLSSDQVTFLQEWAPNSIQSYDLTPPSPALCSVRVEKGGIFKSCLCSEILLARVNVRPSDRVKCGKTRGARTQLEDFHIYLLVSELL